MKNYCVDNFQFVSQIISSFVWKKVLFFGDLRKVFDNKERSWYAKSVLIFINADNFVYAFRLKQMGFLGLSSIQTTCVFLLCRCGRMRTLVLICYGHLSKPSRFPFNRLIRPARKVLCSSLVPGPRENTWMIPGPEISQPHGRPWNSHRIHLGYAMQLLNLLLQSGLVDGDSDKATDTRTAW